MAHHEFSPSRLARMRNCPGSYALTKTYNIPEPPSEDAEEGHELHSAIELGKLPEDQEQAELVSRCVTVYKEILASIGQESKLYHEQLVQVLDTDGTVLTEGTADVVIEDTELEMVTVIDWKFGRNPVSPAGFNLQTMAYGYGAAQKRGWHKCRCIIFQPRLMSKPDQAVFDGFAFNMISVNIRTIISTAKKEFILQMGEHCTYCPARSICPEMDYQQAVAIPPTCKDISPAKLEEAFQLWKILEKRGSSIEYHFKKMVEAGQIPGWEIRKRSGGREFTDLNEVASKLYGHFNMQELLSFTEMSVSKVEDAFAAKLKEAGTSKTLKEGKEQFAALLGDLVKMKPEQSLLHKAGK